MPSDLLPASFSSARRLLSIANASQPGRRTPWPTSSAPLKRARYDLAGQSVGPPAAPAFLRLAERSRFEVHARLDRGLAEREVGPPPAFGKRDRELARLAASVNRQSQAFGAAVHSVVLVLEVA